MDIDATTSAVKRFKSAADPLDENSADNLPRTTTVVGRGRVAPPAPIKSSVCTSDRSRTRRELQVACEAADEASSSSVVKGDGAAELRSRLSGAEREISDLRRQNATLETETRQLRANADEVIAANDDLKSQVTQLTLEYRYLQEVMEQERMEAALSVNGLESEKAGVERNLRLCQEELVTAASALDKSASEAALLKRELDAAKCGPEEMSGMRPAELRALARACSERAAAALKIAEEKEHEARLCQICSDRPRRTLLAPCLHLTCGECAARLTACPFCAGKVEARKPLDIDL